MKERVWDLAIGAARVIQTQLTEFRRDCWCHIVLIGHHAESCGHPRRCRHGGAYLIESRIVAQPVAAFDPARTRSRLSGGLSAADH